MYRGNESKALQGQEPPSRKEETKRPTSAKALLDGGTLVVGAVRARIGNGPQMHVWLAWLSPAPPPRSVKTRTRSCIGSYSSATNRQHLKPARTSNPYSNNPGFSCWKNTRIRTAAEAEPHTVRQLEVAFSANHIRHIAHTNCHITPIANALMLGNGRLAALVYFHDHELLLVDNAIQDFE